MRLEQPYMKQKKYIFLREAKAMVKIQPQAAQIGHHAKVALVAMLEKLAIIFLLRVKGSIHGVKKYIIHLRYRSSQLKPTHHLLHRHSRIPPIRPPPPSPGQAIFRTRQAGYMNRSSFGGRVQPVAIVTSILS